MEEECRLARRVKHVDGCVATSRKLVDQVTRRLWEHIKGTSMAVNLPVQVRCHVRLKCVSVKLSLWKRADDFERVSKLRALKLL